MKHIIKSILTLLTLFLAMQLHAQKDTAGIVVYKDPRIELLVRKQIQINEVTTRDSRRTAPGFRIQVINSTE